jgi:hypothetical protein
MAKALRITSASVRHPRNDKSAISTLFIMGKLKLAEPPTCPYQVNWLFVPHLTGIKINNGSDTSKVLRGATGFI